MKVRKTSNAADENLILSACVTSKRTLSELSTLDDVEFATPHAQMLYRWCDGHFNDYGEAPGIEVIKNQFASWSEVRLANNPVDRVVDGLEKFLSQLSDTPVNCDLVADKIAIYFSRNSLKALSEGLQDAIALGDVRGASDMVATWKPTEIGGDASVDVLSDEDAIRQSFEDNTEVLVNFQGDLGRFFGRDLARDSFVSFLAAEKQGKTTWMAQIAWRAMMQKRNVAFIELGDMSQPQYMRVFARMAARLPDVSKEVSIPVNTGWHPDEERKVVVQAQERYLQALTADKAVEACNTAMSSLGPNMRLRLAAYPNSTMTVANIEATLDRWERSNWRPDVIVLDYADLLLPPKGYRDDRDGINQNWKMLRKMSQERHCLVLTATQAAARGYDKWLLDMGCFSEDKRKLSHVTSMIGINRTPEENTIDVCRLNHIVRRNGLSDPTKACVVAGCRDIGHVAIRSCY